MARPDAAKVEASSGIHAMNHRPTARLTLLAALLVAWPALAFDPGADPYAELNKAAREAYAAAKAQALRPDQPVFLVGRDITLMKDGQRWTQPIAPALYRDLKSLSHIPLGIFAAASAWGRAPDDPQWMKRLGVLRGHAEAALATLDRVGLSEIQQARQRDMLQRSIAYVDGLGEQKPEPAALRAYAASVGPATLANAADAAKAGIDDLHRAVTELRAQLAPGDWERAYVLILAPKTPRDGNLAYAYFANAMGRAAEGQRLIYAESIFDQQVALNLLRTLVIDRSVGEAFYGDPSRMERDLLADGATAALLPMFGRLGP
jgi:hypothetical protein